MDIAVVGAGVFGAWTAHHLARAGARVTLVDAYGPANPRASSGDESRIIRCGYGPDRIYTQWARRSLVLWQEVFDSLGVRPPLFHRSGVLWMSERDDAYTCATLETLRADGSPVELLEPAALSSRWPHLSTDGVGIALFEPDCGVLMARRAVQALVADLERRGARVLSARAVVSTSGGRTPTVTLSDGHELTADAFVFACGPWLPAIFPDVLTGRIRPTRQVVIYFGTPPGDARFGAACTPAWVDFKAGIYGVPSIEDRGLKIGLDRHGPPFDPDTGDRVLDAASVETARAWLRQRFPALADAPVVEGRVCQYENTSTGDFLIDRHPAFEHVWIAGGGSGHGFKHGPAVGEHVAALVQGRAQVEPRFALAGKDTAARRAVY